MLGLSAIMVEDVLTKIKEYVVAPLPSDQGSVLAAAGIVPGGNKKPKVYVAMSGGVDSSVSAALLKRKGYEVTGVFIKVWQPDFLECERGDDRREAMRAAAHLSIPFLTFDFEKEYKEEVVDYMIAEYKAGRTPNPDVVCNKQIKFEAFLKKARELGADYIATGHYARIETNGKQHDHSGRLSLIVGQDKNKDQSYFLWTLTQETLRRVLFPVGKYSKPEVRKMAREFGLPNAKRRESQGLCFVGEFDMKEFLKHFIPQKRGDVLDEQGKVIGYHDGAAYFTLGKRHGFTVVNKKPDSLPLYVIAKDVGQNTITVSSNRKNEQGVVREILLEKINWIRGEVPEIKKQYHCRFRYRQLLVECALASGNTVIFTKPQDAVAPGQSLVLYYKDECLGGGVIAHAG